MLVFKKEKSVRKLALEHAVTVRSCLLATSDTFGHYLRRCSESLDEVPGGDEDFSDKVRQVGKWESKADKLKRETCEVLQSGAFLPTIRSDVYRLIETIDHVAGQGENTARFLADQSPAIPETYHTAFLEITALNLQCYEELLRALEYYFKPKGKMVQIDYHVTEVGKLESEVDKRQVTLMQWIFSAEPALSSRIHLGQLLTTLCGISDSAQKVSDELKFAALKSVV